MTFRRQHAMGVYILDFYCAAARLVVEIDGAGHTHDEQLRHDERRDAWLRAQGLTVERVWAEDVMADPDAVADAVTRLARSLAGKP